MLFRAKKLGASVEEYFARRGEERALCSAADLAGWLGISIAELKALSERPDTGPVVQRAMTRIAAQLESDPRWMGSNCSKSVFLLRQKLYGGYSDKPEPPSRVTVTVRLEGMDG